MPTFDLFQYMQEMETKTNMSNGNVFYTIKTKIKYRYFFFFQKRFVYFVFYLQNAKNVK